MNKERVAPINAQPYVYMTYLTTYERDERVPYLRVIKSINHNWSTIMRQTSLPQVNDPKFGEYSSDVVISTA